MNDEYLLSKGLLSILIVGSGFLTVSPVSAATFAASKTTVEIKKFSHQALGDAIVITEAEDLTIAKNGEVNAESEAWVDFTNTPQTYLKISALAEAQGAGNKYLGQGEGIATVIGNFFIEKNQVFSFDFSTYLDLKTVTDDRGSEKAEAGGNVFLGLYEITDSNEQILLDSFFVGGHLETGGKNDFLDYQNTPSFIVKGVNSITSFGTTSELPSIFLTGSFSYLFESNTYLSLVEFQSSYAVVQTVPEPSMTLAFFLFGFVATGIGITPIFKAVNHSQKIR